MDAEWGPALNDIRHTVAANAVAELPLGFSAGGIFLAYSGRPYTAQLGYDFNGDGTDNDRPHGVGKGTLTGKAFAKLDLFVNKEFRLRRAVQAQPSPGSVQCARSPQRDGIRQPRGHRNLSAGYERCGAS